jgi:hypothetical protein
MATSCTTASCWSHGGDGPFLVRSQPGGPHRMAVESCTWHSTTYNHPGQHVAVKLSGVPALQRLSDRTRWVCMHRVTCNTSVVGLERRETPGHKPSHSCKSHLPQLILQHAQLEQGAVQRRQRSVQHRGGWHTLQQLLKVAVLRLLLEPPALFMCISSTLV